MIYSRNIFYFNKILTGQTGVENMKRWNISSYLLIGQDRQKADVFTESVSIKGHVGLTVLEQTPDDRKIVRTHLHHNRSLGGAGVHIQSPALKVVGPEQLGIETAGQHAGVMAKTIAGLVGGIRHDAPGPSLGLSQITVLLVVQKLGQTLEIGKPPGAGGKMLIEDAVQKQTAFRGEQRGSKQFVPNPVGITVWMADKRWKNDVVLQNEPEPVKKTGLCKCGAGIDINYNFDGESTGSCWSCFNEFKQRA